MDALEGKCGAELSSHVESKTPDLNLMVALLQEVCGRHDPEFHPKFKQWCDDYFLIKHRQVLAVVRCYSQAALLLDWLAIMLHCQALQARICQLGCAYASPSSQQPCLFCPSPESACLLLLPTTQLVVEGALCVTPTLFATMPGIHGCFQWDVA